MRVSEFYWRPCANSYSRNSRNGHLSNFNSETHFKLDIVKKSDLAAQCAIATSRHDVDSYEDRAQSFASPSFHVALS